MVRDWPGRAGWGLRHLQFGDPGGSAPLRQSGECLCGLARVFGNPQRDFFPPFLGGNKLHSIAIERSRRHAVFRRQAHGSHKAPQRHAQHPGGKDRGSIRCWAPVISGSPKKSSRSMIGGHCAAAVAANAASNRRVQQSGFTENPLWVYRVSCNCTVQAWSPHRIVKKAPEAAGSKL